MSGGISLSSVEKAIEAGKAKAAEFGIESGFGDPVVFGGGYPDQDHDVAGAVKAAL
jgi:hypothetical protein